MNSDLFHTNKYARIYFQIIENAEQRHTSADYVERHHIIPKSMGGKDTGNVVSLTAKEHYVAHHLLTKMCARKSDREKMIYAFFKMQFSSSTHRRFHSSRAYEWVKSEMAALKRLNIGEKNHFYGKKHDDQTRAKMRAKRVGRVCRRDYELRSFVHNDGRVFCGTQMNFYTEMRLCNKGVNRLVKGNVKSHHGWRLLHTK